ncbi:hypothetical protein LRP88_02239 [Fusarium phalaenopsidis]
MTERTPGLKKHRDVLEALINRTMEFAGTAHLEPENGSPTMRPSIQHDFLSAGVTFPMANRYDTWNWDGDPEALWVRDPEALTPIDRDDWFGLESTDVVADQISNSWTGPNMPRAPLPEVNSGLET